MIEANGSGDACAISDRSAIRRSSYRITHERTPAAMTNSITQLPAARNRTTTRTRTEPKPSEHGVAVLRASEAKGLISLGMDAIREANALGHEMHAVIYDPTARANNAELQDQLAEVLTCMETAEHYLCRLGSVFEERPRPESAGDEEVSDNPLRSGGP
jgi:hypothetical protein